MRRLVVAGALTVAVVVAVLLYRSPPVARPGAAASSPSPTRSPTSTPSPSASTSVGVSGTFAGPRVPAYQKKMGYVFGDVQVTVTVAGGRIVAITTPVLPPVGDTGGRGTQPITDSITQFAVPILRQEALHAQSARIHAVSGATYTALAFIRSLQGALTRATG